LEMSPRSDEGLSNQAVAERLATRPGTVSKWRGGVAQYSLAGLADAPRSGKPRHYEADHERRIIARMEYQPLLGLAGPQPRLQCRALLAGQRHLCCSRSDSLTYPLTLQLGISAVCCSA
jgi:hypothetical protein